MKNKPTKTVVAAQVPISLAQAVRDSAKRSDRSVSREIARVLRTHYEQPDDRRLRAAD